MIFDNTCVYNLLGAIRGCRLSYNSKSKGPTQCIIKYDDRMEEKNAMELLVKLVKKGPSHRKFMRQILVSTDITAPRYWWMQFDTYKVGVTAASESTMHTIMKRPITIRDFAFKNNEIIEQDIVKTLEDVRRLGDFKRLVTLLPQSYLQKRHVTLNYEVIYAIREQRHGHKLEEWEDFIRWSDTLPYAWWLFAGSIPPSEGEEEEPSMMDYNPDASVEAHSDMDTIKEEEEKEESSPSKQGL